MQTCNTKATDHRNYYGGMNLAIKGKIMRKYNCEEPDQLSVFNELYSQSKCHMSCEIQAYVSTCQFVPLRYQPFLSNKWLNGHTLSYNVTENESYYRR